jgi:hypothetical protein
MSDFDSRPEWNTSWYFDSVQQELDEVEEQLEGPMDTVSRRRLNVSREWLLEEMKRAESRMRYVDGY